MSLSRIFFVFVFNYTFKFKVTFCVRGVMAAICGNNPINDYYEYLITEKAYPPYQARHKACRRLATLSFGILKSGEKYQPYRKDCIKKSA